MGNANTKVSHAAPDVLEVASGGSINIQSGGKITSGAEGAGTQASAITALTDSSGGTPGTTLAAITAGASYAQADIVALKNAVASLAANLNAATAALKAIGATA